MQQTGPINQPFTYTGREWDTATGLYYYRARYYDPTMGRFISEDPIGFLGGINFYPYVNNNPTNFIDPFGLDVRALAPHEKRTIQDLINRLKKCKKWKYISEDLQKLLNNGRIKINTDLPPDVLGTSPMDWSAFFRPTIELNPIAIARLETLVHEWVHTTQVRGNIFTPPLLSWLNATQGLLNGRGQGFLDDAATATAQKVCGDCPP